MSSTETTQTSKLRWLVLGTAAVLAVGAYGPWLGPTEGASLLPCPIRAASGEICPGCGMTRACIAIARQEWSLAWNLHPFAYLVVPAALAWSLAPANVEGFWWRVPTTVRRTSSLLVILGLLGFWLLRINR